MEATSTFEIVVEEQAHDLADAVAAVAAVSLLTTDAAEPIRQIIQQSDREIKGEFPDEPLDEVSLANDTRTVKTICRVKAGGSLKCRAERLVGRRVCHLHEDLGGQPEGIEVPHGHETSKCFVQLVSAVT
ncbi:hypothetical protein ATO4_03800 [Aurantimonas sp. 22II-16-19i]|nr:hypothetical protein ATO4_03800 [Aurantimonas sp. 22II-16-19i]